MLNTWKYEYFQKIPLNYIFVQSNVVENSRKNCFNDTIAKPTFTTTSVKIYISIEWNKNLIMLFFFRRSKIVGWKLLYRSLAEYFNVNGKWNRIISGNVLSSFRLVYLQHNKIHQCFINFVSVIRHIPKKLSIFPGKKK